MRKLTALLVAGFALAAYAPSAHADPVPIYPTFQCTPLPYPTSGGIVGATLELLRSINEAGCALSEQTFYNVVGAAYDALGFVYEHTPGCCIYVPGPPLPAGAQGYVTDQVGGQAELVCGFLLGNSPLCFTTSGPHYPAGQCAVDVPEEGGVVGDVLNLAEDSCARADVLVDYTTGYAGDVVDWVPCCIAVGPIVTQVQGTVNEATGIVMDHARTEVQDAGQFALTTCDAVVGYAVGESCIQQY